MKKLAIYGIIVGSALVVGVGGGTIVKRFFTDAERDYSGFDPSIYQIDGDALITKVDSYETKKLAFDLLPGVDVANYALEKYKRCDNCYSYGIGLASTIVDQVIRNAQIKNGNTYFEESVSKSKMVGVANRSIQTNKGGDVDLYKANGTSDVIIDDSVCGYGKTPTHLTADGYEDLYGRTPCDIFNYLIHKDTVRETTKSEIENGYQITLVMDPDISTYNYQFQMQTISNLNKKPTFSAEKLTFTIDSNFVLKSMVVDEAYKAVMGVEASITAHIEYTYFADEYYKIPDINENFDYKGLSQGGK